MKTTDQSVLSIIVKEWRRRHLGMVESWKGADETERKALGSGIAQLFGCINDFEEYLETGEEPSFVARWRSGELHPTKVIFHKGEPVK